MLKVWNRNNQTSVWSKLAAVFIGAAAVAVVASGCSGGAKDDNVGLKRYQTDFSSPEELKKWQCFDTGKWKIEDGWLVADARIPEQRSILWLNEKLVNDVQIEFDAECLEKPGDLNCFLCGNGKNYSGYEIIIGGWVNERLAIAKSMEDGNQDARKRLGYEPIELEKNHVYSIKIKKYKGTIRVYVDDELIITERDKEPLRSQDYRSFGFSTWENVVRFDNLKIEMKE